MSYRDIVPEDAGSLAVQGMYATIVLYVGAVANLDEMYVTSDYGVEPYGAVVSHLYVAYDGCSFAEVAMLTKTGSRHPRQFLYYRHVVCVVLV